jgi:DNA-binding transcriptional regulator YdaS (Cro superfamily)
MKKQEVIEFFGGNNAAARALGITKAAVSAWGEDVPPLRVFHVRHVMEQVKASEDEKKSDAA